MNGAPLTSGYISTPHDPSSIEDAYLRSDNILIGRAVFRFFFERLRATSCVITEFTSFKHLFQ